MKKYPFIYSLSTLGLIHHQEFDYKFHPFRTDFIGESGSGKSMIADLIQLIFVGSEAFVSATQAVGKREPEGMVLTEGGHSKTMGYAFLNIEMEPNKYLIAGAYIETGNKNVQAFIIQQGFDKDSIAYLDSPISYKDFVIDDQIQPLDRLKDMFSEKGFFCQSWLRLKKYHELLYKLNIVPIDLAANDRQLKGYAEIFQSFSRGKLIDTQKSSDLKDFLFGKEAANKIYDSYKTAVKDMEATLKDYGTNLKEIERVTSKYNSLLELGKSRDESNRYQKNWIEKQLFYTYQEKEKGQKEIADIITDFSLAKQHYVIVRELLNNEILQLEQKLPELELEHDTANNKYQDSYAEYKQVEKVEYWLKICNCTIEQLPNRFSEDMQMRSYKTKLSRFIEQLKEKNLEQVFEGIEPKNSIVIISQFLNDNIADLKSQIDSKEILKRFSNLKDPESFAYWAIQQKRAFSLEEESVILEFQKLPRKKSENRDEYLPSPNEFIAALQIVDKEENGFWVNLNGVRRFVPNTSKQVFNTTDVQAIESYFATYSNSLEQELVQHNKMLNNYQELQLILLNLSKPNDSLAAYLIKHKIAIYQFIEPLNISETEFERALTIYKNSVEIKEHYLLAKQNLDETKNQLSDNKVLLNVYKSHQDVAIGIGNLPEEFAGSREFSGIEERINQNYELTKANVATMFKLATDKIAFVNKNKILVQPKLYSIAGIQDKLKAFQDWEQKLDKAKQQYQQLYLILPDKLTSNNYIQEPKSESDAFFNAERVYIDNWNNIIQKYIPSEAYRIEEKNNLTELAKHLLPEAFHDAVLSDRSESTTIEAIANYLHRINDKNRQLNNRKIQKIKDLLHEVDVAISEQENTIRRINNFLKNESVNSKQQRIIDFQEPDTFLPKGTNITGGYKATLKKSNTSSFSKEWMFKFLENLENATNNFAARLAEKIDLEQMIITAFQESGGYYNAQVTVQKLLDPSVYYDVTFNMESDSGRVNKGSTGQTYAAIALLCIARLSVMDNEEGKKQQPAVRIMPIDEAEGLGSNYDMLHDVAQKYDYQVISLSIGPVGKFKDGEQYIYMLHKNMETEAAVNYMPMAILCEADKSTIANNIEL